MDASRPLAPTRRPLRRLRSAALVGVALLAASCSADWDAAPLVPPAGDAGALSPAESCEQVVDNARAALAQQVERSWSGGSIAMEDAAVPSAARDSATAGAGSDGVEAAAGEGSPTVSGVIGTNTQERDVDEADIVKTDGTRIVSVVDGVLRVVELDGSPAVDGSLDLNATAADGMVGGHEMFLRGDEVVLVASSYEALFPTEEPFDPTASRREPAVGATSAMAPTGVAATTLTVVSLADPASPTVTETATVEGSYVSARMADGTIRLVLRTHPRALDDIVMAPTVDAALELVGSVSADGLLPRVMVDGEVRPLGSCDDVLLAPVEQATMTSDGPATGIAAVVAPEFGSVTALTIRDGLSDLAPVTIQGVADTVYATTDALYVAGAAWDGRGSRTDVHRLALPADGPAVYTGSGAAPGHLLNQFSLSERGGALRVVTTVEHFDDPRGTTSARLTILDTDGSLDEIGHLDGLGMGEQVKSVRFLDDLGYVVTFRTTDPLYALDLSDPRAPRALGELKIPGFSEYLHPIGDGLLLGVGRQADPTTGTDQGFKVSLFDVSDPAAMVEVHQIVIPDAYSPVGNDHRAFLWDAGRSQAVIPIEQWHETTGADDSSAMVLRVDGRSLRTAAMLRHPSAEGSATPLRSVVVGEDLWTLSGVGLGRSAADAPTGVDLLGF